jgi:hypothetical protein
MLPSHNSPPSSTTHAGAPPSSTHQREADVGPTSVTRAPSASAGGPTAHPTAASPSPAVDDDLEKQSKEFLLQRVRALERQLKVRNDDCARLLNERQQLLPLKEKCASQKEMILALRGQLDLAQAQRESAVDAMEMMKRRQRDQEHRDRIAHAEWAMYSGAPGSASATPPPPSQSTTTANRLSTAMPGSSTQPPSSAPNIGRRNPGGTVVNTAVGPQLLYDSSDISSVGFTKNAKLPYDFLGGPGAQQQYLARYNGGGDRGEMPDGGHDASEDAQVRRVIAAAKDQADVETKYAEMEDKEEAALMARIKALREGRK